METKKLISSLSCLEEQYKVMGCRNISSLCKSHPICLGKAWVVRNLRASCWLNASIRQLPQQDEPFVPMPLLIPVITEGTEAQSLSKRLYAHGCCWMLFRLSYITINQKSLFTRRETYHAAVMGKMPRVSNLVMHSLFFVFSMEIFLKLKEGWFWKMIDNTHILYRLQKFLEKN